MVVVCVAVAVTVSGAWRAAAAGLPPGLSAIIPLPQQTAFPDPDASGWLKLDAIRGIVASPDCRDAAGGIDRFIERLRELHVPEAVLPPVNFSTESSPGPGFIHLGLTPNAEIGTRVAVLPEPPAEGYRLVVDKDAVYMLGSDLPGLYHGLMTLRQLVDAQGRIAQAAISDWPDFPLRGAYMAGSAGIEARILQCAALKLNFMLFESGDFFCLGDAKKRACWQDAFALCRKHFIEPVPELQSLGWGQFVLAAHPEAAEGIYMDKQRFEVRDGAVRSPDPPAPPAAVVVNAGFDDSEGGVPAGWAADRQYEGVAVDREGAHTGAGCLRITRTENGTTRLWQNVTVLPQNRYEFSCFLRTKGIAPGTAYGEVYGLNPDGQLGAWLGHAGMTHGDQDWRRMAAVVDSGSYTRLQIYLRVQDAAGTAWFDDVAVAGVQGANPLSNVLITASAPVIVQDETGGITYEEGRDYRLVPAPLSYPFGTGAPLRVEIVADGRIKDGSAVLLSCHRVPPDSVTCCPSEPLYQEFMRETIHSVVGSLKPKYLHIGHDEPRVLNRDRRCTARGLSNSALFADDIKRMQAYAREADPAIRVMMWSDAVNPYHNGPSLNMNDAAVLIPKDVVQCPWWYSWPDSGNRIENSTKFFLELGFEVTGSPWFDHRNVQQWADTLHRHRAGDTRVLGPIYTSWSDTTENPWQALQTSAQYSWSPDKISLDEFLKQAK